MMHKTYASNFDNQKELKNLKLPGKLTLKQKLNAKVLNAIKNLNLVTAEHPSEVTLNYIYSRLEELRNRDYSFYYYEDFPLKDKELLELREDALLLESYFDKYQLFKTHLSEFVEGYEKLNAEKKLSFLDIGDLIALRICFIKLNDKHIKKINKQIAKLLQYSVEYRFLQSNEAIK